MNYELEKDLQRSSIGIIEILFRYLPGGTEKTTKKPSTLRIQSKGLRRDQLVGSSVNLIHVMGNATKYAVDMRFSPPSYAGETVVTQLCCILLFRKCVSLEEGELFR
jgi:hypothetical protein